MATAALSTIRDWVCPACGLTDQTNQAGPHTRYHTCPKLRFLSTPMIPAGTSAKIVLRERDDYVGTELVQLDPERGRPVMALETRRPDGSNDSIVYAPAATGSARA